MSNDVVYFLLYNIKRNFYNFLYDNGIHKVNILPSTKVSNADCALAAMNIKSKTREKELSGLKQKQKLMRQVYELTIIKLELFYSERRHKLSI